MVTEPQKFSLFVPGEIWSLNRERKIHHHARAALVQPLRHAAQLLARNWLRNGGMAFTTPVHVSFYPHQQKRGSLADTANHLPPCKAVLDGCVDAGLIPEDTPAWVLSQTFYPPVKTPATGIMISVEAADEAG